MKYTAWLLKHIPDLTGKHYLVTGANSGLGFYHTQQLAFRHAHVYMACRNLVEAEQQKKKILEKIPDALLTVVPYDQSSFASIDAFCGYAKANIPTIDGLVLNAGIILPGKDKLTPEGFPLTTGVNFFNVYYLLRQLLGHYDRIQKDIRVVFVGSFSSYKQRLHALEPLLDSKRTLMDQYGKSKLALAMLHHNLQMNLNIYDFPVLDHVTAILVHPGLASTNIVRSLPLFLQKVFKVVVSLISHSAESGALSMTYAAANAYVTNGTFIGPNGFMEAMGFPTKIPLKKHFSKGSAQLIYQVGKYIKQVKGE
jgi:NAD(P)-dependent dehydrogenase (short-subunit alcohol dehydrogenase family)